MRGQLDAAEAAYEQARELFAEIGHATLLAATLSRMAEVAIQKGDPQRAEKLMREAVRLLGPLGQHGELAELQADLAAALAEQGKFDEAERFIAAAEEQAPFAEPTRRHAFTTALAAVRLAQGREEDAETLYREAVAISQESDFIALEAEALRKLVRFLDDRGRGDDAVAYTERLSELSPIPSTAQIA
jgi:tetratricopeptide (TPR) repeat protein